MKKQIKKIVSISVAMLMVFSFTACGTKKKDTASGVKAELESTEEMAKLNEEETEIVLEISEDTTFKDECGNEIPVQEGEELVVVEKTTDEAGESVYILDNGSVIKENDVSEVATEKITVVETTKENVLKNETKKENTTIIKKKAENKTTTTNKSTSAKETTKTVSENKTEKQTTTKQQTTVKQTEAQTQPATQKQTQPQTTQPQTTTKQETTTVPQTTVKPTEPQTTQPATTKPQETTTQQETTVEQSTIQQPTPYVGYREDLDMEAKQLILNERAKTNKFGTMTVVQNPEWNEHLYKVAKARAKEVVGNFTHNSPGGYRDGYNVSEALTYFSIHSYPDAADKAISNWVNSPQHHRILLMGDQYAVACYQNGKYIYWVCITADSSLYIAENWAASGAEGWGSRYEEKYEKYYNSFVEQYGERKIW